MAKTTAGAGAEDKVKKPKVKVAKTKAPYAPKSKKMSQKDVDEMVNEEEAELGEDLPEKAVPEIEGHIDHHVVENTRRIMMQNESYGFAVKRVGRDESNGHSMEIVLDDDMDIVSKRYEFIFVGISAPNLFAEDKPYFDVLSFSVEVRKNEFGYNKTKLIVALEPAIVGKIIERIKKIAEYAYDSQANRGYKVVLKK